MAVVAVGIVSSAGGGDLWVWCLRQWVLKHGVFPAVGVQQLGVGAGVFPAGVLKHGVLSVVAMEYSRPVWAWGVGSCSSLGVAEAWASSRGVGLWEL